MMKAPLPKLQSQDNFERLFQSMAEQNKLLVEQLSMLNSNMQAMMENSDRHLSGIRKTMNAFTRRYAEVSGEMLKRQGNMVDLEKEILEIGKTKEDSRSHSNMKVEAGEATQQENMQSSQPFTLK